MMILLPQVFKTKSALLTDRKISVKLVVYNEVSSELDDILKQRAELGMEQPSLLQIDEIRKPSLTKTDSLEMLVEANFFEDSQEQHEGMQLFQFKGGIALGGTFDHLHNGHKLLLTQALLCSDQRVLCGVTTDALLRAKAHAEFLQPFDDRKQSVIDFCTRINSNLFSKEGGDKMTFFSLEDPIGPTGTDAGLEALVLTREVEKGGKMVINSVNVYSLVYIDLNDARTANGLPAVQLVFVDMILADANPEKQGKQFSNKTSSTYIREYLAKHN